MASAHNVADASDARAERQCKVIWNMSTGCVLFTQWKLRVVVVDTWEDSSITGRTRMRKQVGNVILRCSFAGWCVELPGTGSGWKNDFVHRLASRFYQIICAVHTVPSGTEDILPFRWRVKFTLYVSGNLSTFGVFWNRTSFLFLRYQDQVQHQGYTSLCGGNSNLYRTGVDTCTEYCNGGVKSFRQKF